MRRGPKPPPLSTDNGHVGQLSVERDVPSFPRLRHPEFMLSTVDIEGATPKPAPGEVRTPTSRFSVSYQSMERQWVEHARWRGW
jgi:hypothetical protein